MNIGGVPIGVGQPVAIVAELSNAHNGKRDQMLALMRAAVDAGSTLLKAQAFTANELVTLRGDGPAPEPWGSQGWSMRRLYEQARTPLEWFPDLFAEAKTLGVPLFASVFGPTSLAALQACGCPAYKVSALDAQHHLLRSLLRDMPVPILVSKRLWRTSTLPHDGALYCPPGYPQDVSALGLAEIAKGFLGVSLHTLHPLAAPMAVALGAQMVEVHVQLTDSPSALEAEFSYDERQLGDMVARVRAAERMR